VSNRVDDTVMLADDELGDAPADPGTYEGGHGKPADANFRLRSKWCARECERARIFDPDEDIQPPDLRRRLYNFTPTVRDNTPADPQPPIIDWVLPMTMCGCSRQAVARHETVPVCAWCIAKMDEDSMYAIQPLLNP
jgi:hypothetical protein